MAIRLSFSIFKDPWSATTHFAGFIAAIVGLVLIVIAAAHSAPKVTGMAIYGASLVLLFLASSLYHFLDLGERGNRFLKRFDHAAIFLLIGGSYVPPVIHLLSGSWRVTMLSVIGALALIGIVCKVIWIDAPRWLSVSLYLGLGWLVVIPAYQMFPRMTGWEILWLGAGGVAYTLGAGVYMWKRPDPWPDRFGFHEIWHLFVLGGATAHYFLQYALIPRPVPPF